MRNFTLQQFNHTYAWILKLFYVVSFRKEEEEEKGPKPQSKKREIDKED